MNKLTKEQLDKVKWVVLPPYDESTTELHIPKTGTHPRELSEGHFYIICLEDYILHPCENFTLAANWNRGVVPQSKYLRCQLVQKLGTMCRFGAIGFDEQNNRDKTDIYPELWLPESGITIVKLLE